MDIAKALRAARVRLGVSQAEFAKRFDIDQSAYSRWETGQREPRGPARRFILRELAQIDEPAE